MYKIDYHKVALSVECDFITKEYYINNDDKQYEYISNLIDNYESNDYADDIEKKQISKIIKKINRSHQSKIIKKNKKMF